MIISDHEVMQNEALLAVTILATVKLNDVEKMLLDSKIGDKLVRLINDRKPKKEVFANVLTLIRQLSSSSKYLSTTTLSSNLFTKFLFLGALKQHLRQSGLQAAVTSFAKVNDSVSEYKDEIAQVTQLLESG